MYTKHYVFESPDDENIKIWRYLDFTKFVSLIDTQKLFFVRTDKLEDPFEGSYSKVNIVQRRDFALANAREGGSLKKDLERLPKILKKMREYVFVNSWHMNDFESAAMWELYLKSDEGVAIQSTFNRLRESFNVYPEHEVRIGAVKYIDYEKEQMPDENIFSPFLHKRKSFKHEHELRAVVSDMYNFDLTKEAAPTGLNIPVDLDKLIEKIYISPAAPEWFYNLVTSVGDKYELKKEISSSALADNRPLY